MEPQGEQDSSQADQSMPSDLPADGGGGDTIASMTLAELFDAIGVAEQVENLGEGAEVVVSTLEEVQWQAVGTLLDDDQKFRVVVLLGLHDEAWAGQVQGWLQAAPDAAGAAEQKMPWSKLPADIRDVVTGYLPNEDRARAREAGLEIRDTVDPVNNPGVRVVYTQAELEEALADPATIEIHLDSHLGTDFELTAAHKQRSEEIPVRAMGAATARVSGNDTRLIAHDSARVTATDGWVQVLAFDSAQVTATGGGVGAYDSAQVTTTGGGVGAFDSARVTATGGVLEAHDDATITATNDAIITAFDSAQVTATGSTVYAHGSARVTATGGAVYAYDSAQVTVLGNAILHLVSAEVTYQAADTVRVQRQY